MKLIPSSRSTTQVNKHLVFLVVSVCGDVFFCTDGISTEHFTQQAEEPSDRQQELRTCSRTQAAHFKAAVAIYTRRHLFTRGPCLFSTAVRTGWGLKHNTVAKHWHRKPFTLVSHQNKQVSPLCSSACSIASFSFRNRKRAAESLTELHLEAGAH